jgi:hypothetical protein
VKPGQVDFKTLVMRGGWEDATWMGARFAATMPLFPIALGQIILAVNLAIVRGPSARTRAAAQIQWPCASVLMTGRWRGHDPGTGALKCRRRS